MLSDSAHAATCRLVDWAREPGAMLTVDPNVRHKLGARVR
jgi:2-dehydro-3-deoxygluconokinase